MKWKHGYSALLFSSLSFPLSIIARYSEKHFEESNNIIATKVNSLLNLFAPDNYIPPVLQSMMAAPWYQDEHFLIIVFKVAAVVLAIISILLVFLSALQKERSLFYAVSVLIAAYSIYFVNAKLSVVVMFISITVILQIRKKTGINV